jgi:outer membrane receptor protein involved in Fe transport
MNTPVQMAATAVTAIGLFTVATSCDLGAQTSPASPAEEKKQAEPHKLAPFEVTGSRIKRLDFETPSPVETFTAQHIETKAFTNIGDFMQSLPFNSSTANSIYQPLSFLRGSATTNLRGLGAQRFLTLINGRRTVPYALVSPSAGTRQVFDLNSLPAAAIESIDFLKDGASAVYGADAITGVLNVKLRKNFNGLSTSLLYGNTLRGTGGDTALRQASIVAGRAFARTRILTAIDVKTANSNFLRDYGVTTTDYTHLGPVKGLNANAFTTFPSNLLLSRGQAAAAGLPYPKVSPFVNTWIYVVPGGTPTSDPTVASFAPAPAIGDTFNVGNENRYNVAETYQVYPAYDYISVFSSVEHEFTPRFKAFADIVYSKNSTYFASTPVSTGSRCRRRILTTRSVSR